MNAKNPNQEVIDEVNALIERVEKLHPHAPNGNRSGINPNISVAVGGLHTCRDNLSWHGLGQLEKAEAKTVTEAPAE